MTEQIDEGIALKAWLRSPSSDSVTLKIFERLAEIVWRAGHILPDQVVDALSTRDTKSILGIAEIARHYEMERDIYLSLYWVAASLGHKESMLHMAHSLARESRSDKPERVPAYLKHMSVKWLCSLETANMKRGNIIPFSHREPDEGQENDLNAEAETDADTVLRAFESSAKSDLDEEATKEDLEQEVLRFIEKDESKAPNKVPKTKKKSGLDLFKIKKEPSDWVDDLDDDDVVIVREMAEPSVVVCHSIGDEKSREAQDLKTRYDNIIGTPLPFRGEIYKPSDIVSDMTLNFPWASNVARYLGGQLMLLQTAGNKHFKLPPLLLVGPPGTGKTTMLEWLCQRLNAAYQTIACGGMADSASLGAITRGWSTSRPSAPIEAMARNSCANPVMLIDELEKGASLDSRNGNTMSTLVSMIQTTRSYYDSCLLADVDISHVSFLATANTLAPLPPALRDRFAIMEVPPPRKEHFDHLLSGVRRNEAKRLSVREELLPWLSEGDTAWLRNAYVSSGCSIRSLEQAYRIILGERAAEEMEMAKNLN